MLWFLSCYEVLPLNHQYSSRFSCICDVTCVCVHLIVSEFKINSERLIFDQMAQPIFFPPTPNLFLFIIFFHTSDTRQGRYEWPAGTHYSLESCKCVMSVHCFKKNSSNDALLTLKSILILAWVCFRLYWPSNHVALWRLHRLRRRLVSESELLLLLSGEGFSSHKGNILFKTALV